MLCSKQVKSKKLLVSVMFLTIASIVALLGSSFVMSKVSYAQQTVLVINEIDYDQISTDTAEFIEIKNVSTDTVNLGAYQLLGVNGATTTIYRTIDLPNVDLAPGDYYVVCENNITVVNCDLDVSPDTDLIQNGAPDAVALRLGASIIDAVSYEGDTAAPYIEGSGTTQADPNNVANIGLSRFPDGIDTNQNNSDFSLRCITPGATNTSASENCEAPTAITLVSFTAVPGSNGVTLAWETGTEVDNAGFNLHRATVEEGPYTKINTDVLPARGDTVSGGSYSYLDTAATDPDTIYYYKLEDIDLNGVSTFHGPINTSSGVSADPGDKQIYLPIIVKFF